MDKLQEDRDWSTAVNALDHLGLDLRAYKRPQLERRLNSFMQREGYRNIEALIGALQRDPALYRKLHSYLTIHVTDLFRDTRYWEYWRNSIQEQRQSHWSVWSAGCSWGAEPVTAALILQELGRNYHIIATDSDDTVLDQARHGLFTDDNYAKIPDAYRHYFHRQGQEWSALPFNGGTVSYRRHDVTLEPPPGKFDAIICRNLIIYFESPVRHRVLSGFVSALRPDGILFLGATETFLEFSELGFAAIAPSIFKKISRTNATNYGD